MGALQRGHLSERQLAARQRTHLDERHLLTFPLLDIERCSRSDRDGGERDGDGSWDGEMRGVDVCNDGRRRRTLEVEHRQIKIAIIR